jgi:RND family efflux transporter MFP subunit
VGDKVNEASNRKAPGANDRRAGKHPLFKWWGATGLTVAGLGVAWTAYSYQPSQAAPAPPPPPPPQVVTSTPLVRDVDSSIGFLGQFSAVDQVELRAQVGGTLTEIHFKDGDVVHKGDLLFVIDPRPFDIRLAQATAKLETATAKLTLANRELIRAQALKRGDAGTDQNVDQRVSDQHAAQASVDDAKAQIRDAQLDLEHSRVTAPFTGRIGSHLVSVGNLVSGSREGTSATTLLATIVSTDPIYLNFDMSEADYLAFSRYHAKSQDPLADKVELALSDETKFDRTGTLDFVNNVLDRSSGTIHARATVPNAGLALTPGEFARVRVVVSAPAPTLLVPDAAVLPDQSHHIVLTVSAEGIVTPKLVEVGDLHGGLRVIRSGLSRQDEVIIGGIAYAAPGSKVTTQGGTIRYAAADVQD